MANCEGQCRYCKFGIPVDNGEPYVDAQGGIAVHFGPPITVRGCKDIDPQKAVADENAQCVTGNYTENTSITV